MPSNTVEAAANSAIRAKMGLSTGTPTPQATPVRQNAAPNAQAPAGPPQPAAAPVPVTQDQLTAITEQLAAMKQGLDNSTQTVTTQQNHIANLEGELSQIRNREEQAALTLPSDEALDELPRAEAIRQCAEIIAEQKVRAIDQKYMGAFSKLATDVITMKNASEELQVKSIFPGVNIEKYRPVLEQKRAQYPQASTVDLVRLVADPMELAAQPNMTQQPQEEVHMETGAGASVAGGGAPQNRGQITEDQLREGFITARDSGNKLQANSYLQEMLKRRPDVPASQGTRG